MYKIIFLILRIRRIILSKFHVSNLMVYTWKRCDKGILISIHRVEPKRAAQFKSNPLTPTARTRTFKGLVQLNEHMYNVKKFSHDAYLTGSSSAHVRASESTLCLASLLPPSLILQVRRRFSPNSHFHRSFKGKKKPEMDIEPEHIYVWTKFRVHLWIELLCLVRGEEIYNHLKLSRFRVSEI